MNNQTVSIHKYIVREDIIKAVRTFFYKQQFHEVITPLLNKALPLEPNLRPFSTTHEYNGVRETFFLPHSPERGIKKMLALGLGNCFAIGKSFRNYERVGSLHLHEFIMLEWYRKDAVYTDIMNDMERLMVEINETIKNESIHFEKPFPRISLNTLFKERVGESLDDLIKDEELFRTVATKKGYKTEMASWEELYDQLFVNEVEPAFSSEPFFLIDFPARVSPLCKKQKENSHFAERFELYIHKIEIANGNTENTDVAAIRLFFEKEQAKTGMPIDEEFLSTLEAMQNNLYAGVGMGIDRLTMIYTGEEIFV